MIDFVTVFHNDVNLKQSIELQASLNRIESPDRFTFNLVDNQVDNRGFSRGCNLGAAMGDAPILGFLNPDAIVEGPFIDQVQSIFAEHPDVVITGSNHAKPQREVTLWGLKNWVCGCTMFVRRDWFEEVGGFDERYGWSFEDTDLCRTAEAQHRRVLPIPMAIHHESPSENSKQDTEYKQRHFALANIAFHQKWGRR